MRWGKVVLVGMGLLGGSLGRALRERRLARTVIGVVRRLDTVLECTVVGATDSATLDLGNAVQDADWIVLCTPLGQMGTVARQLVPFLKPGATVTDVGSAKAELVRELEPLFAATGATFVGAHPMAGAEKLGVKAARADLFQGAVCVVTPTASSPPAQTAEVIAFWQSVGCEVICLSPEAHDVAVAWSSHLPHVVAATLADQVLDPQRPTATAKLCATGFKTTTRIASGSPEMWRDIVLSNRVALDRALAGQIEQLTDFRRQLAAQDAGALMEFFSRAKRRRDDWSPPAAAGTAAPGEESVAVARI